MRKIVVPFLGLSALIVALSSCQQSERYYFAPDVMDETYVHRYGVEVSPEDWTASGNHGQIVSSLANGIVITKSYKSGVLDGETTYSYPHSAVIEKTEVYANGVLQKATTFYMSGAPKEEIFYSTPENRTIVTWYETNAPKSKEQYEGHLLSVASYYGHDNQVESQVVDYKGTRTRRDEYGQLLSVDTIENGSQNLRTTFHPNGSPKEVIPYANNMIHGQVKTYYPAGEPHSVEEWNNGTQSGLTIEYLNGEKAVESPYVNGQKHGVERRYRDGKTVVQETSWIAGEKQGPCVSYVGDSSKVDYYWHGKQVTKSHYDILTGPRKAIWKNSTNS